ncbi:multicopper oxidase family protein [Legionella pneumophila]|uniref:multicopper oxidase family protein n=1 Tax=Legionella pneumophila TaxID=446 RepID=UPI000D04A0E3|nr:multicopper oxidase family protein [Legionella pneumophila]HAT7073420.1 multicopper oxidase domain-containing protein [Legionella pneumophila]HAU3504138.1 multicopper oxidase family protein [Legionella pneumophila]HAU3594274.1 multicopper oxidase family protein [Legionella pneumophila]HAU3632936.1 multicopper oxidase family protein [Legionella pneumophila]HAU4000751.1 multicopper oxidase family protein [Legionella pneumophila]
MNLQCIRAALLGTLVLGQAQVHSEPVPIKKSEPTILLIKKYQTEVDGKPTDLFRIEQPDGTWGYHGVKGQIFDAIVKNQTDKATVLHWHGLIVPNDQDGVPYVTQAPIPPGGQYHYHFLLRQSGTYWMHSHHDLQVQQFLSAPLIIADPNDKVTDKEVTLFLGDFSFKKPEVILSELKKGQMTHMHHGSGMSSMLMDNATADLNDVRYDAFLTNYKTLKKPEIVSVHPGDTVRLRFIAGSAMSNFFINTGILSAEAIAVDGEPIKPVKSTQFQLAVGQRLDVLVTIPQGEAAYPILAQGEGTDMQTGLILATPKAIIPKLSENTSKKAGALNYNQEFNFKALNPLPIQSPGQTLMVNLEGDMMRYVWTINNQKWPEIKPLIVTKNKRVEMVFNNNTMMAHPMHLHGHVFEVTEIDGKKIRDGLLHDTVLVLPKSTVKIQFDSDNPGNWMLHCHMLYHQETGMMTLVSYEGVKEPNLTMHH